MSVHELTSRRNDEQAAMLERVDRLRLEIISGEVQSLAIATTNSNATFCAVSFGPDKLGTLGAVTILQQQLASDLA